MPSADNKPASRRFEMACSTFFHDVFWVRIAPTITSKAEFPGHQCCGPSTVKRELKYSSSGGRSSAPRAAKMGKSRDRGDVIDELRRELCTAVATAFAVWLRKIVPLKGTCFVAELIDYVTISAADTPCQPSCGVLTTPVLSIVPFPSETPRSGVMHAVRQNGHQAVRRSVS